MDDDRSDELEQIAAQRTRAAIALTTATIVMYFGFILLVAFDKPLLGQLLAPGLSVGIALGAGVIVVSWVLTGAYVRWANRRYDGMIERIRGGRS
jgi:uncharacterized membrane protein (DUF485 family)